MKTGSLIGLDVRTCQEGRFILEYPMVDKDPSTVGRSVATLRGRPIPCTRAVERAAQSESTLARSPIAWQPTTTCAPVSRRTSRRGSRHRKGRRAQIEITRRISSTQGGGVGGRSAFANLRYIKAERVVGGLQDATRFAARGRRRRSV